MNQQRRIPTGLHTGDDAAYHIIDSVIGQISDGIWEESSKMFRYARFADGYDVDTADLLISNQYMEWQDWNRNYQHNPYSKMSDPKVLRYFANKIKEIALIELEDKYRNKAEKDIMNSNSYHKDWTRCIISFVSDKEHDEYKRLYEQYHDYIEKNPFDRHGKFKPSDEKLIYLKSNMANAYRVYRALLTQANEVEKAQKAN